MMRGMRLYDADLVADLLARAVEIERSRLKAHTLAGLVAAFVIDWAQYLEETEDDAPTLEHWAAWAHVSERSAYRRLADFRRLTGEHDPTERARALNAASARRSGSSQPATA
jgi:hypothetical protein